MYKCSECGREIKSLFHDPDNHDIRTNIGITEQGEIMHLRCPPKE